MGKLTASILGLSLFAPLIRAGGAAEQQCLIPHLNELIVGLATGQTWQDPQYWASLCTLDAVTCAEIIGCTETSTSYVTTCITIDDPCTVTEAASTTTVTKIIPAASYKPGGRGSGSGGVPQPAAPRAPRSAGLGPVPRPAPSGVGRGNTVTITSTVTVDFATTITLTGYSTFVHEVTITTSTTSSATFLSGIETTTSTDAFPADTTITITTTE
jgi:hypothetical protein